MTSDWAQSGDDILADIEAFAARVLEDSKRPPQSFGGPPPQWLIDALNKGDSDDD